MSKHTEGPWLLNPLTNPTRPTYYCVFVKPGGPSTIEHICQVAKADSDNFEANAHLIAAAPDLLAALTISRGQWIHSVNKDQCLAAIAKAEGENE